MVAFLSACGPLSTYAPFDPVLESDISQTGMVPVLIFDDDIVKALYDESPLISTIPTPNIIALVTLYGIRAINVSVVAERRRVAERTTVPLMDQLNAMNLTGDIARALDAEMHHASWAKLGTPVAISRELLTDKERESFASFKNYAMFLASIIPNRPEKYYLVIDFHRKIGNNYMLYVDYKIYSTEYKAKIYSNSAFFTCDGAPGSDWVNWWSANNGERLRSAYAQGIDALIGMVGLDLDVRTPISAKLDVTREPTGVLSATCKEGWWK
jgi:hypothetical protein